MANKTKKKIPPPKGNAAKKPRVKKKKQEKKPAKKLPKPKMNSTRKKGDPGTLTAIKKMKRKNLIKEILVKTRAPELILEELRRRGIVISRWSLHRDMAEIESEAIDLISKVPKEEVFMAFMEDMDADNRELLKTIIDARKDIKELKRNQRSNLYNAITDAISKRVKNRTEAINVGQSFGIYPKVKPQLDVHITHEMRVEVTIHIIKQIVAPIIMSHISKPEDQRDAAKDIDRRISRYLHEPDSARAGQQDAEPSRGRPRNR